MGWFDGNKAWKPVRPDDCDFKDVLCPKCGCNDVQISSYPAVISERERQTLIQGLAGQNAARWVPKYKPGQGSCAHCGVSFPIHISEG